MLTNVDCNVEIMLTAMLTKYWLHCWPNVCSTVDFKTGCNFCCNVDCNILCSASCNVSHNFPWNSRYIEFAFIFRFFSKFHKKRMEELNDTGLQNFTGLFLVLANCIETGNTVGLSMEPYLGVVVYCCNRCRMQEFWNECPILVLSLLVISRTLKTSDYVFWFGDLILKMSLQLFYQKILWSSMSTILSKSVVKLKCWK